MHPDELPFLESLHARPSDDGPRLIYADWLDERADPRGEYLRLEIDFVALRPDAALYDELRRRLDELRTRIPAAWLAEVGRTTVRNCPASFTDCPRRWPLFARTNHPRARYCAVCQQPVYHAADAVEAERHVDAHERVALDSGVPRGVRLAPRPRAL